MMAALSIPPAIVEHGYGTNNGTTPEKNGDMHGEQQSDIMLDSASSVVRETVKAFNANGKAGKSKRKLSCQGKAKTTPTAKAVVSGLGDFDGMDIREVCLRSGLDEEKSASLGMELLRFQRCRDDYSDFPTIQKALTKNLAINDWEGFTSRIASLAEESRGMPDTGELANYIPELGAQDPSLFAVSICTVDGQIFNYGDFDTEVSIQSGVKPLNYALACKEHGVNNVSNYVGIEASGLSFNEVSLNDEGKPHNPMINAGAIMTCSLIKTHDTPSSRLQHIMTSLQGLSGGLELGFEKAVYLSESRTAYRNQALAYYMESVDGFPAGANPMEALDTYLQCCSLGVKVEHLARIAATFANNGTSPLSGDKVLSSKIVDATLTLMFTCGMYDYSGEWASKVGMPAKSGVSGIVYVVIPGVMGLAVLSPKLDRRGNTSKGLDFCLRVLSEWRLGIFQQLVNGPVDVERLLLEQKLASGQQKNSDAAQHDSVAIRLKISFKLERLVKLFRAYKNCCNECGELELKTVVRLAEMHSLQNTKVMMTQVKRAFGKAKTLKSFAQVFHCVERGSRDVNLLIKALLGDFHLPDFAEFRAAASTFFSLTNQAWLQKGDQAPQFDAFSQSIAAPDGLAISICTVDGQQLHFGDAATGFPMKGMSKTLLYLYALEHFGLDEVHQRIGNEMTSTDPTGFKLNYDGKPFNAFMDSGALCLSKLILEKLSHGSYAALQNFAVKLCSGRVGFNQMAYLAYKDVELKLRALSSYLQGMNCYGEEGDANQAIDAFELFLETQSLNLSTAKLAQMAAMLANKGVSPSTHEKCLSKETVHEAISALYTCGMNQFAGVWQFNLNIPAAHGSNGGLLAVIPDVMGIAIFSPNAPNAYGVSEQAIEFLMKLNDSYELSIFSQLTNREGLQQTTDDDVEDVVVSPQMTFKIFHMIVSAASGDTASMRKLLKDDCDVNACDYDQRTCLHLACAESKHEIVEMLVSHGADPFKLDRWKVSPVDEARKTDDERCLQVLENYHGSAVRLYESVADEEHFKCHRILGARSDSSRHGSRNGSRHGSGSSTHKKKGIISSIPGMLTNAGAVKKSNSFRCRRTSVVMSDMLRAE